MSITKIFSFENKSLTTIKEGDNVWFYGKEVAEMLGYRLPHKAITDHIKDDEKRKVQRPTFQNGALVKSMNWQINEPGVYRLIFSSKLESAEKFKTWVFTEVLPSIRKTGQYVVCNQLSIMNETDLHYNVVKYIRAYHPLMIIPGLGEYQDTFTKRTNGWKKGYTGGQPDLIVPQLHKVYNGFAIELKTPNGNGVIKDNQVRALRCLRSQGYKTLLSSDIHEIIHFIEVYMHESRLLCEYCNRRFKSETTLSNHQRYFHRIL